MAVQTIAPKAALPAKMNSIPEALEALRNNQLVVVLDSEDRENEGDLVGNAATVTAEQMALMIRHTSGIICCPMTAARAEALQLPPMVAENTDAHGTAFTVTVDARGHGVTTGVSAADRAATCRVLAAETTRPEDLRRPGHVFPLRARPGGTLERAGHTEAAVDLLQLADIDDDPVAVIGEVTLDSGEMARRDDLLAFARTHGGLCVVTIEALIAFRRALPTENSRG